MTMQEIKTTVEAIKDFQMENKVFDNLEKMRYIIENLTLNRAGRKYYFYFSTNGNDMINVNKYVVGEDEPILVSDVRMYVEFTEQLVRKLTRTGKFDQFVDMIMKDLYPNIFKTGLCPKHIEFEL